MIFHLTPGRVVGTDVFHAAILLWVAGAAHWFAGNVDFALMVNTLLGSVPGVWIGARLSGRLPERGLRLALGTVLLASALGLVTTAGADIPAPVIIAAPLGVTLTAWLVARRVASSSRSLPGLASEAQ